MSMPWFLSLSFGISLVAFACVRAVPAARSPEAPAGLPIWLVMVWGPSLAAIILSWQAGTLSDLLLRAVQVQGVPAVVWGIVLLPLALLVVMRPFAPGAASRIGAGTLIVMVGFNLILGPMGEELGWRGYMQEHLGAQMGWLAASLIVGVVWFVWHVPLWAIPSPHAQINIWLFGGHVMLYAVIIGAAYALSAGSILPAILLHLTLNLASNVALYAGYREPNDWFRGSLLPYGVIALVLALLV